MRMVSWRSSSTSSSMILPSKLASGGKPTVTSCTGPIFSFIVYLRRLPSPITSSVFDREQEKGARLESSYWLESSYSLALLAHDEGVSGHVPEALVLSRDQHCYEGNQVAK